jgi:hypothetical protein
MKTQTLTRRITFPKTRTGRLTTACGTRLLSLLLLLLLPAMVQALTYQTLDDPLASSNS